jgi:hypothetical protein
VVHPSPRSNPCRSRHGVSVTEVTENVNRIASPLEHPPLSAPSPFCALAHWSQRDTNRTANRVFERNSRFAGQNDADGCNDSADTFASKHAAINNEMNSPLRIR